MARLLTGVNQCTTSDFGGISLICTNWKSLMLQR